MKKKYNIRNLIEQAKQIGFSDKEIKAEIFTEYENQKVKDIIYKRVLNSETIFKAEWIERFAELFGVDENQIFKHLNK